MSIAIAKLQFQWDTDKLRYRDSGVALFRDIQDFWASRGMYAEIVDVIGTSGERVIVLSEIENTQIDKKDQMQSNTQKTQVGISKKLDQFSKQSAKIK